MSEIPDRIGRWALGDIAEEKSNGKLWRVVSFITSPAVVFHELITERDRSLPSAERVEVAGCRNELSDLVLYRRIEEQQ